jgi:hypothetical protein
MRAAGGLMGIRFWVQSAIPISTTDLPCSAALASVYAGYEGADRRWSWTAGPISRSQKAEGAQGAYPFPVLWS